MMKKLFYNWLPALLMTCAAIMTGCTESKTDTPTPPDPTEESEMAIEVVSVESGSATLKLTTKGIASCAWIISTEPAAESPQAVVVYRNGEEMACNDGENLIKIIGKQPNTTYYMHVAGMTTGNTYHETVLATEFTTVDVEGFCTLMEQYYDGYQVYVNLPAEVKERKNVLRYSVSDIFFYNYIHAAMEDAAILISNGGQVFGDDEESGLLTFNDANIYLRDENGDMYEDDLGQNYMLHNPIVPGEPALILFGEFGVGTDQDLGTGYYGPLFDYDGFWNSDQPVVPLAAGEAPVYPEDEFWTGFHQRVYVSSKAPEKLDAKLNLTIEEIGATNATIRIKPDPEIDNYWLMVLDDASLAGMMSAIDNNKEYLQWFIGSYYGTMAYSGIRSSGNAEFQLRELYNGVAPESKWNVLAVGLGDEIGSAKTEVLHTTFTTTGRTKPRPIVQVKVVDTPAQYEDSPYFVWFNVKCTSKDAVYGKYAADYDTEWEKAYANKDATNAEIIGNGNAFTSEEIYYINSDEGLTFGISTLDGRTTRCGVMLYNDEDYPNNPDDKMSEAVADAYSPYIPDKERVESELFTTLEGEWTLTAKAANCKKEDVVGDWVWYELEEPLKTKVTISNGVVYPATLPQEVYDAYAAIDKDKDEVDKLYAGFCAEADAYNARLRGQNRLLCLGMNDAVSALTQMNAFQGFYMSGYNSVNNVEIFNDFGPKWYLEIDKNGNVTAPFNYSQFAPASNWVQEHTLYMAAIANTPNNDTRFMGPSPDYDTLHFPVEVSDNGNTITVKCLEFEVEYKDEQTGDIKKKMMPFYPNIVDYYYNTFSACLPKYVSEWTLTRGWDEKTEVGTTPQQASFSTEPFLRVNTGNADMRRNPMHQLSRVPVAMTEGYKKIEYTPVTFEESQARMKAYAEKRLGIKIE